VPAVERQQRYQVDRTQHEVQLGQEEPERDEIAVLERVAADDRRAHDADRCLRIAFTTAEGVHQRADLGGYLRDRLAQFDGEVTGESHGSRYRRHRIEMLV